MFEDFLKKKNEPQITLRDLIIVDYIKMYAAECEYIKKNYIPEVGPSEILQGELLREIELIRKEEIYPDDVEIILDNTLKEGQEQVVQEAQDGYKNVKYIETYLSEIFERYTDQPQKVLFESMQYSLLAGGKRLRPIFVLDFCRMCGGGRTSYLFKSGLAGQRDG